MHILTVAAGYPGKSFLALRTSSNLGNEAHDPLAGHVRILQDDAGQNSEQPTDTSHTQVLPTQPSKPCNPPDPV